MHFCCGPWSGLAICDNGTGSWWYFELWLGGREVANGFLFTVPVPESPMYVHMHICGPCMNVHMVCGVCAHRHTLYTPYTCTYTHTHVHTHTHTHAHTHTHTTHTHTPHHMHTHTRTHHIHTHAHTLTHTNTSSAANFNTAVNGVASGTLNLQRDVHTDTCTHPSPLPRYSRINR